MKHRFPGFRKCMEMMRKRDPQTQEDGFHALRPVASEYVRELMEEFAKETNKDPRCWLLELIGYARSPEALDLLAAELRSHDEMLRWWAIRGLRALGTKEARTLLWQARSFTFDSAATTAAFHAQLEEKIIGE